MTDAYCFSFNAENACVLFAISLLMFTISAMMVYGAIAVSILIVHGFKLAAWIFNKIPYRLLLFSFFFSLLASCRLADTIFLLPTLWLCAQLSGCHQFSNLLAQNQGLLGSVGKCLFSASWYFTFEIKLWFNWVSGWAMVTFLYVYERGIRAAAVIGDDC